MGRRPRPAHRRLRARGKAPLSTLRARPAATVALVAAALFTALALLCAAHVFTGLDQHAVDQWMPGMDHGAGSYDGGALGTTSSWSEILLPGWQSPLGGSETASLVTYGWVLAASGLPSLLVLGAGLLVLWRRDRRLALALLLGAAFVLLSLAEVASKHLLERDVLTTWVPPGSPPRLLPFDHSFPSGHTLRSWLMAGVVWLAWPAAWPRRSRWLAPAWAAAVPPLLVSGAWHTPTDVAGGALLAVLGIAAALALEPWLARQLAACRAGA